MYTKISSFLCPSDSDRLTNAEGHCNYSANAGSTPNSFYFVTGFDGLFQYVDSGVSPPSATCFGFRDITDGLSQTAAFSERVKGFSTNNQTMPDPRSPTSSVVNYTDGGDPTTPQSSYVACKAATPANQGGSLWTMGQLPDGVGTAWHNGFPNQGMYNHVMTPNGQACFNGQFRGYGVMPAASRHNGVVNVLFADGSTRAVKSSIQPNVWWALGSREGKEVVSADQY